MQYSIGSYCTCTQNRRRDWSIFLASSKACSSWGLTIGCEVSTSIAKSPKDKTTSYRQAFNIGLSSKNLSNNEGRSIIFSSRPSTSTNTLNIKILIMKELTVVEIEIAEVDLLVIEKVIELIAVIVYMLVIAVVQIQLRKVTIIVGLTLYVIVIGIGCI